MLEFSKYKKVNNKLSVRLPDNIDIMLRKIAKKEEMSLSEAIRKECGIINNFIDEVFGEGIAEKVFKGKNDLQEHMELFKDVMNAKIEMTKATQNLYDNLEYKAKYMPNRETRRHNSKKGRR